MPGQDQAVEIVWYGLYGMHHSPPAIKWEQIWECGPDNKGFYENTVQGKICVAGAFYDDYFIRIADLSKPLSETALSHELFHAQEYWRHLYDPYHKDPGFQPGGLVDQANDLLVNSGL